jgi:perosamine synthetase
MDSPSNMKEKIKDLSLPATGTIRDAMRAIDKGAIGLAILLDPETEKFVGLVTDGDLRRALLNGYGLESPAIEVPRPDPRTAPVGLPLNEITSLLDEKVRWIPLLDKSERVVDLALFDRRMRLPVAEPLLGEKELSYVSECVLTGWVSSAGKFVTKFEEMFADFCGTRYAIATSNGTTALHLTLLALDIGPGDEVIVPSLTFIATANAVTYTGARPVFIDSEVETWNIDPDLLESSITPKTKAIIPVHLYGHPSNMDPILETARRYGLAVIEDAAEAHGARYKGTRVGSLGDLGIFSFYGNKIITTGEGGMIVTSRQDLNEKARILRDHGMSPDERYWHPMLGFNYRMTNLQAALGVAQMEKIDKILDIKKKIANTYKKELKNIRGIKLPPKASWAENVFWLYSILVDPDKFGRSRNELMNILKDYGIDTRPLFIPVHEQPIYDTGQSLPVSEWLSRNGLSLPSSVNLTTSSIVRTSEAIRSVSKRKNSHNHYGH